MISDFYLRWSLIFVDVLGARWGIDNKIALQQHSLKDVYIFFYYSHFDWQANLWPYFTLKACLNFLDIIL